MVSLKTQRAILSLLVLFSFRFALGQISIVSYNVENLFDATHDEGKFDYEFLPLSFPGKKQKCYTVANFYYRKLCLETDWTPEKLELKLSQLERVFRAMPHLPQLVALVEVENESVVRALANRLGYPKYWMTESPDERGVDVALLFRGTALKPADYGQLVLKGPLFDKKPTRNILRVHFTVPKTGETLAVYVNHWPSQAATTDVRIAVAEQLKQEITKFQKRIGKKGYHVLAIGDFNTLEKEKPNPIVDVLSKSTWDGALMDAYTVALTDAQMPPGSYWYKSDKKWNRLDRMLVSKNLLDGTGMEIVSHSFSIFNEDFMTTCEGATCGVPMRYDFNSLSPDTAGYSDHFPIAALLQLF